MLLATNHFILNEKFFALKCHPITWWIWFCHLIITIKKKEKNRCNYETEADVHNYLNWEKILPYILQLIKIDNTIIDIFHLVS